MKLVVISPEHDEPREIAVLGELFAAGLERYHARKPAWSREKMETWLRALPREWRARVVLHQHHELVDALDLGGRHWRDNGSSEVGRGVPAVPSATGLGLAKAESLPLRNPAHPESSPHPAITSQSCHDLATLRTAVCGYDTVFFGPVFPSLSKPGYGPRGETSLAEISAFLASRSAAQRRPCVLALGGINAETAPRALALGFDGVAVLGAIWQSANPVLAFAELQNSLACHAA